MDYNTSMKIFTLEPHSYCEGVTKAFLLARKAKKEHPDQRIYLLGSLVHNEDAVNELTKDGFILIDERKEDLCSSLNAIPVGSIVIFSAHGHPEIYDEIAKNKQLIVYDATCSKVKKNLDAIAYFVHAGREVIFLGERLHLEAVAALSYGDKVHFLDAKRLSEFDFSLVKDKAPAFLTQTTMSEDDVREAGKMILSKIPAAFIMDGRCESTKKRQFNFYLAPKEADVIVVLGSITSNNTMKLVSIAKESHPDARVFRARNLEELQKFNLSTYHYAILASGASTSPSVYNACLEYLKNL